MNEDYKTIVIKIGTNALLTQEQTLNNQILSQLVAQINNLLEKDVRIVLVSSGAMASGEQAVGTLSSLSPVSERQLLAAVGQVELMLAYRNEFKKCDRVIAQVLATKEDFRSRQHYLNMRNCFQTLLQQKIVPIVNENDVVSVEELMFTDNDELAGLVASMLDADRLIVLTNVDGIYVDDKKTVLSEIGPDTSLENIKFGAKSSFGRGGIRAKLETAKRLSAVGIATHIVNANTENVIARLLEGEEIGTVILPMRDVRVSNSQRWVADSYGHQKGEIVIDDGAEKMMLSEKSANLLPTGICSCKGEFKKGDVVSICNEKGQLIGMGKASYGNDILEECIGKRSHRAFIRCNYFFPVNES